MPCGDRNCSIPAETGGAAVRTFELPSAMVHPDTIILQLTDPQLLQEAQDVALGQCKPHPTGLEAGQQPQLRRLRRNERIQPAVHSILDGTQQHGRCRALHIEGLTKVFYTDEVETHALTGKRYRSIAENLQPAGHKRRMNESLAESPSILLADEPSGNLDSHNGEAVMELLKDLHKDRATICMVKHDPLFTKLAEREVQLFDGQVVSEEDLRHKLAVEMELLR